MAAADAFDRAIAVFSEAEPPAALSARMSRVQLVDILIALGRLERAGAVLDQADAGFVAARDTTSVHAARATIAHAELAYAKGDESTGQTQLDQAMRQIDALKEQGTAALPQFATVAAHFQRAPEQSRAVLNRLRGSGLLPASPDDLRIDIADRATLESAVGRLYLTVGEVDRARAWLTRAVELRTTLDVADSPWLAEAQLALAEALVASGQKADAQALPAHSVPTRTNNPDPIGTHRRAAH